MSIENINHTDRGHAEFSPSSLKYVAQCAGFHGKNESSAASEMGTRIHEALEVRDPSALHNAQEQEIYDQIVQMEADFMSNFAEVAQELNEIQVTVELIGTETWGTCDRLLILEGETKAVMADYKTGISIIDPPEKNYQAKAYTIGAFQRYPKLQEIVFVFYVPQHYQSLHHTFTRSDLPSLVQELSQVVTAAERTRPKWNKGTMDIDDCTPSQYCRFCRYEDGCPSLGGLSIAVAKKLNSSIPDVDLSDLENTDHLAELYHISKIVENWAAAVKERTLAALKEGITLDGLKLRSMGKVKSVTDNATLIEIAKECGLDFDDILKEANFPLGKMAKAVGSLGTGKTKKEKEEKFLDACQDAGIVSISDERFTIASH
jgi:hypothetical protein